MEAERGGAALERGDAAFALLLFVSLLALIDEGFGAGEHEERVFPRPQHGQEIEEQSNDINLSIVHYQGKNQLPPLAHYSIGRVAQLSIGANNVFTQGPNEPAHSGAWHPAGV